MSVEKIHTDRLYEGLNWLLSHKPTIEKHLKERLGSLFDLEYDLLLYDVTSTYFEGVCEGNGLAKRGYGRPWGNGCSDQAWVMRRERCWRSYRRSKAATWCFQRAPRTGITTAQFACDV